MTETTCALLHLVSLILSISIASILGYAHFVEGDFTSTWWAFPFEISIFGAICSTSWLWSTIASREEVDNINRSFD